ncbi:MAG TPA: phage holin family protein [Baekduia sp.]|nr:phage holin family protein [Baekduia sp.]
MATAVDPRRGGSWQPAAPRLRPLRLAVAWLVAAAAVWITAWLLEGVDLGHSGAAFAAAAVIAVFNAVLPPALAALRLPYMLVAGFLLVLAGDAVVLLAAAAVLPDNDVRVDSFGIALLAALMITAVSMALHVLLGTDDDDAYSLRVTRRIAGRQGRGAATDLPGIVFLEIDGLGLPILRDAIRDGSAPNMARWITEDGYRLAEWETDLSSQTGASQAGILLGSNEDIPAFRWVEKETGLMMVCSSPADCAEIERRHATGIGLLVDGGASRGNLLSGEADETILTVSRTDAERGANPGYRAFLANGFNVTRALVLFFCEVVLEVTAAVRAARRDVRPRGHRGGSYPLMRAALCVVVRDLIVFGVLTDMMRGRPAVYATFSSYDEVAHHSGLQRADTMEALRKLDRQLERLWRAREYAPRPYEIVVLSDHGQTQGATFKQRNGYGLEDLVARSLTGGRVAGFAGGDEQDAMVRQAVDEASGTGSKVDKKTKNDVSDRDVVVLGSGNLGLVYLMDPPARRLTLEEIYARHPALIGALRDHPHVGWLLVRSAEHGAVVLGPRGGAHFLDERRIEGEDPLAPYSPTAPDHLRRTDGFAHVADLMVGSFYDPMIDEGCAFEELISFHGGLGGPQTRAFILAPPGLPLPDEAIVGAAAVHGLLRGWRQMLQDPEAARGGPTGGSRPAATARRLRRERAASP